MVRAILQSLLAGCCVAVLLSGCSGPLIDAVPSQVGGLPAGAPERPATPYNFPAVHDMPPSRGTDPLTDEQQYKLQQELQKVRDRQERREKAKKADTAPKKQANGAK